MLFLSRGVGEDPQKTETLPTNGTDAHLKTLLPDQAQGSSNSQGEGVDGLPNTVPVTGRGCGRPKMDSSAPVLVRKSKTETLKSKPKLSPTLWDITGTYDITCEEVERNWLYAAEGLSLAIVTLSTTSSVVVGSFDLVFLEGTMLFAADGRTLERARQQLSKDGNLAAATRPAPALKGCRLYFT